MILSINQPLKQAINIVFITDQNYANLTAVAIRSLVAEFEKTLSYHEFALFIFVICIEVTQDSKDVLGKASRSDIAEISIDFVDHALDPGLKGIHRWRQLVSLKICLPDILVHLERAIFLDSDIVVVDDISKLWWCDLEGHWLGVVPCLLDDPSCLRNYNIFKVKFDNVVQPINAGVMLLDFGLMRKLHVTETLLEWQSRNSKTVRLPEQEAISVNYPRQWKVLPHAWNFRPFGETYWTSSLWEGYKRYLGIRPSIVHFQANVRPFDLRINLPFFGDWMCHYRHVNPDGVLNRKRLSYFQFVFFEYPDIFCRLSSLLPGGLIRFISIITLLGLFVFPYAIVRYFQYLMKPNGYQLRINSYLAKRVVDEDM